MPDFSLNPAMMIEVKIRFIAKGTGVPLTGDDYKVKLFDQDIIGDDHLGESGLNGEGVAIIKFSHSAFGEWNSLEKYPDFYFVLDKAGKQIYKSAVLEDFDVNMMEEFKMGEGEVVDLGTFLVEG